jgi:hypothetical protein
VICPECGTNNAEGKDLCAQCGAALPGQETPQIPAETPSVPPSPKPNVPDFDLGPVSQAENTPPAASYPPLPQAQAPPPYPLPNSPQYYPVYPPADDNLLNTLIPSHNPNALTSYYLGIFSILPLIGTIMGIIAVILGIKGLKLAKQYPQVRGTTHAWVGIITGILFGGFWLALTLFFVIALLMSPHR